MRNSAKKRQMVFRDLRLLNLSLSRDIPNEKSPLDVPLMLPLSIVGSACLAEWFYS